MAANIAEVINLFTISDSKISLGEQSTLYVKNLLFDNLRVLTPSVWSESLRIAWTCNFHEIYHVIKDNNLFQSLLGFPGLNLIPNLDLIVTWYHVLNQGVSNLLHFSKGLSNLKLISLQTYKLQLLHFQSLNLNYRLIVAFILKPWSEFKSRCLHLLRNRYLEHEIVCFAKIKFIFNVFFYLHA